LLWLSCVTVVSLVAVLLDSVGTSYIVAVLCDRLLWGWAFCLNDNKRVCYATCVTVHYRVTWSVDVAGFSSIAAPMPLSGSTSSHCCCPEFYQRSSTLRTTPAHKMSSTWTTRGLLN